MLRFNTSETGETEARVAVHGLITSETASLLHRECLTLLDQGSGVELDLSGVTFVDSAGAEMLRRLLARGATIGPCSPIILEFVEGGKPQAPKRS